MTWLRAGQITGKFPENKYDFSRHLTRVGDYIQTFPMSLEDYHRIRKAAYAWAWQHKCRVSIKRMRRLNGLYHVEITLTDKQRLRDYK